MKCDEGGAGFVGAIVCTTPLAQTSYMMLRDSTFVAIHGLIRPQGSARDVKIIRVILEKASQVRPYIAKGSP